MTQKTPSSISNQKTVSGSCLCGLVKFEVSLPGIMMNNCYCSRCRKASGASFGSFLHTTTEFFQWVKGEAGIINYIPQEGNPRPFCRQCGSRMPSVNNERKHVVIPAGMLNEEPELAPSVNLYTASKA